MEIKTPYIITLAKTLSGHYYSVRTEKRFVGHFPSVTTFLNAFPVGEHLIKWIAENGFHESRAIRDEAGRAGTKIHLALEDLLKGEELLETGYTMEEWVKIKSFVDWHKEYKPEIIATEFPVFSKKGKYAGKADCIASINGEVHVIDWKSSKSIHPSMALQVAAYANAVEENTDLKIANTSIVQLGAQNKNGYRFVLYPDWRKNYKVFQSVQRTWIYDNEKQAEEPPILELPDRLKL